MILFFCVAVGFGFVIAYLQHDDSSAQSQSLYMNHYWSPIVRSAYQAPPYQARCRDTLGSNLFRCLDGQQLRASNHRLGISLIHTLVHIKNALWVLWLTAIFDPNCLACIDTFVSHEPLKLFHIFFELTSFCTYVLSNISLHLYPLCCYWRDRKGVTKSLTRLSIFVYP